MPRTTQSKLSIGQTISRNHTEVLRDEFGNVQQNSPPTPLTRLQRARAQEQLRKVSHQLISTRHCNCAFALESTIKYTLQLLSLCAPETLRPLADHNMKAVMNDNFRNVILPHLPKVEQIIRNRNSNMKPTPSKSHVINMNTNNDDGHSFI
jgi:hypothetical protein